MEVSSNPSKISLEQKSKLFFVLRLENWATVKIKPLSSDIFEKSATVLTFFNPIYHFHNDASVLSSENFADVRLHKQLVRQC